MIGVGDRVFSIKPTLTVAELVGVDPVTQPKALHPSPSRHDDARAVGTGDERESRTPRPAPRAVADGGIPAADAGGLEGDEYLARGRVRDRQLMKAKNRWRSESIDRCGPHPFRDVRQT